jgi:serine/threonine-protein kinase
VDEGSAVTLTASTGPAMRDVPDVRGLSKAKATKLLDQAGFTLNIQEEYSPTIQSGYATGTFPVAGTKRAVGSAIDLTISAGPKLEKVPSVTGLDRPEAENQLRDAGFQVSIQKVDSEEPEDTVVSQDPAAQSKVEGDSAVTLSISNGSLQPETVPNVGGLDESRARGRLSGAGFKVKVRYVRTSDLSEDGVVLGQDPKANEPLKSGGIVHIDVGRFDTSGGANR